MDSLLDFTGKTAIVTGGRRGLGKAMAADARIGLQKTTENPLKNQFRIFLSFRPQRVYPPLRLFRSWESEGALRPPSPRADAGYGLQTGYASDRKSFTRCRVSRLPSCSDFARPSPERASTSRSSPSKSKLA